MAGSDHDDEDDDDALGEYDIELDVIDNLSGSRIRGHLEPESPDATDEPEKSYGNHPTFDSHPSWKIHRLCSNANEHLRYHRSTKTDDLCKTFFATIGHAKSFLG